MLKKWNSADDIASAKRNFDQIWNNHLSVLEFTQPICLNSYSDDLSNSIEIFDIHASTNSNASLSTDSLNNDEIDLTSFEKTADSSESTLKGSDIENEQASLLDEKISKMWENFSVSKYDKKSNSMYSKRTNNYSSIGRSQSMKYDILRSKLTVPQPPSMLLRGKRSCKTRAMLDVEARRQERIRMDNLECTKQFKANPLPSYLKNQNILKERSINSSNGSENSFKVQKTNRDKSHLFNKSRNWIREDVDTTKSFQARPFPQHIFTNSKESELERQLYRDILKKSRSERMLRTSSMPPSMMRGDRTMPHDCASLEHLKNHTFHPMINSQLHVQRRKSSNKENKVSTIKSNKCKSGSEMNFEDKVNYYILKSPGNRRNASFGDFKTSNVLNIESFDHGRIVSSTPRRKVSQKKLYIFDTSSFNRNDGSEKNRVKLDHTYSSPECYDRNKKNPIKSLVSKNIISDSVDKKGPIALKFKEQLQLDRSNCVEHKEQIEWNLKLVGNYERDVEQLREELKKKKVPTATLR